jgi:DNA-binding NarL/FixJ family response regulator
MTGTTRLRSRRTSHERRIRKGWKDSEPSSGRQLSKREAQVLRMLAQGRNNAEIARELYVSRETVKKHVSSILTKVEAENRVQAAVYAVRKGIV